MTKLLWKLRGMMWLWASDLLTQPDPDDRHSLRQAWMHFAALANCHYDTSPRNAYLEDMRNA